VGPGDHDVLGRPLVRVGLHLQHHRVRDGDFAVLNERETNLKLNEQLQFQAKNKRSSKPFLLQVSKVVLVRLLTMPQNVYFLNRMVGMLLILPDACKKFLPDYTHNRLS